MRIGLAATIVLATTACSLTTEETTPPPGPPELASGKAVPSRCAATPPRASATVTFVANGSAWALDPRSGKLTCVFAARRPGPFVWGPRGDRALLAHLEVKSFGDAPSRPPTSAAPGARSWGRPIGKSIVFVGRGGRALLKAHPAGGGFTNVTPIPGARYEQVVYHPSGLAFAFIVNNGPRQSLWISSNTGMEPRQLVHGRFHTSFDAIAFAPDGRTLYFAAHHGGAGSHVDLHSASLLGGTEAPVEWRGGPFERVSGIVSGRRGELAFTAGRSCSSRRAVVVTPDHAKGADALPGAETSRAVGWIDDAHLLVAAGGCGRPLDLYSVAARSLAARLLVKGVAAAAVRRPERLPPPQLPRQALEGGSGLA